MGFADAFRPLQALAASRAEAQNAASLLRDSQAYAAKLRAESREQTLQDDEVDNALKGFKRYRPGMMSGATNATAQAIGNAPVGPMAGLMRAGGDAVRLKGMSDAAAEAPTWIQTGLSLQEKRDAADRDARVAAQAEAREAAAAALDATNQTKKEIANLMAGVRRDLADNKSTQLKRIPPAAMKSMIDNDVELSRVQSALDGVATTPKAFGPSNMGPGAWLKNNLLGATPDEQGARAAVADIGSQTIHDRTGAAVSVSEFPRLAPFVPSPNDKPELAKKKLARLKVLMEEEAALFRANFGPDQGYMEFQGSKKAPNVNNDAPPPARRAGETPKQYEARIGGLR